MDTKPSHIFEVTDRPESELSHVKLTLRCFDEPGKVGLDVRLLERERFMRREVFVVLYEMRWWMERGKWNELTNGKKSTRLLPEYGQFLYWNIYGVSTGQATGLVAEQTVTTVFKLTELRRGSPALEERLPRWYAKEREAALKDVQLELQDVMDS